MRLTTFSILAALTLIAGCGIKPDYVDPPQGHKADQFPHVYPNPITDKK